MKTYDEITKEAITSKIDSSKGYTYSGKIVSKHVDDTRVIMEGSVNEFWPNGMEKIVPGYDIYEECLYYHTYTEEELKAIQDEKDRLAKEEADRLAAEKAEEEARKEAEEAAIAQAKAQAKKEESWNAGLDKINDIDAQITYTAMMTDTLLTEDDLDNSGEDAGNDSSEENSSTEDSADATDNTSTKEDTNNE